MKRLSHMLGVTLLEIMLVLAIAAMVIVMSIRYYSTASISQQTNAIMGQIQAITAAEQNLSVGVGGFSGGGTSAIQNLIGAVNMKTPWGTAISITANSGSKFTITIPTMPVGVCTSLKAKMSGMTKYTGFTCTGGTENIVYNEGT